MEDAPKLGQPRVAVTVALGLLLAAVPILLLSSSWGSLLEPLTIVLAVGAAGSVLWPSDLEGTIDISAAFVCFMLAVAFVGPLGAFLIAVVAELVTWAVRRYRKPALAINLAATAIPSLLAALLYGELVGTVREGEIADLGVLALVTIGFLAVNFVIVRSLVVVLDGGSLREALRPPRAILFSLALTVALIVSIAGVFAQYGIAAGVFLVLILVAFSYMSRKALLARQRTGQYAALSWGVLSALVRSLDRRDSRTARHSAAVAAFARDIAIECGMDEDAELAHTAGLLHDIGRFALPDRVMERQGTLTEDDWDAIRLHPELGADLLQDLGLYGPVAQIVRSHHERIDGRGYPDRLKGDEIAQVARIVAVAEVYDTLTAHDTYRDRMTSFQAITELRRVAGRQLDERFVEALVSLLSGRGMDYRHADAADFDSELKIAERIQDSISTDAIPGSGLG
ncbi:MAG: HD domain-containing protein, partial [Solirubrobacterales bacterium]|nr:HD domain-containing protein [Solirubrobacterales bacterium]